MKSPAYREAPVDFQRLREISDDDEDLMNDLVGLYLQQTQEFLDSLKTAIAGNEFDSVSRIAHKAVGGSETCGMSAIIPFLRELERSGKSQNLTDAGRLLDEAQAAFERIRDFLENNQDFI